MIRQGTELQVNSHTTNSQFAPAVASDGDGDFVVTWTSSGRTVASTASSPVASTSAGAPQGLEFQVNSYTASGQSEPAVAAETNGDFVVVWESFGQDGASYGVFAQRFNASGAAQGIEFQVNSYTPAVSGARTSRSRATATSSSPGKLGGQDGDDNGVFARRFNSAGAALAGEFQVNTYTPSLQTAPRSPSTATATS